MGPCLFCWRLICSLSFFPLIAGALLPAKPQAAARAGTSQASQITSRGSVVFTTQGFCSRFLPQLLHQCHGPDVQQHGLRMDSLQALLTGGMNGKVVIPGNSQESHIVRRLLGLDQPRMPYVAAAAARHTARCPLHRPAADDGCRRLASHAPNRNNGRQPWSRVWPRPARLFPQQRRQLLNPLRTHAHQFPQGDTMYLSNSKNMKRLTVSGRGVNLFLRLFYS